ncbi:MAG TPA: class I SAM-dependent methyltransferase [Mycobacterium sp.]|uniref:class I SAM-dependent methyltransferase n=1 Tax=Mycobacterium sp. TaxID=1785 RepID=UPI002D62564B|nr:class I SAM-dependent methyltransferase [Mycobacterium sp.]HZU48715.1 class I SAM-dependent methyltransferase [Mycobacterium sp.]
MADTYEAWSGWTIGKLGGAVYDFGVEREWLARPAGLALWGTDTRLLFDTIRAVGEVPDGSAVLDIPCGGGLALRGLRKGQRVRYVAADISPDMLERARRRASVMDLDDVEFAEADIQRIPFGDNEFDLGICLNGLHCLPDPAAAVREISRCLAAGGRLVGSAVVRGAGRRQDMLIGALQRTRAFGPGGTADDLHDWLTEAGLRVDRLLRSGAVAHFAATRD